MLALLLQGKPNKLIARELNVSVETVKDHVAAVLRALGVSSRTQAVLAVSQMAAAGGTVVTASRSNPEDAMSASIARAAGRAGGEPLPAQPPVSIMCVRCSCRRQPR